MSRTVFVAAAALSLIFLAGCASTDPASRAEPASKPSNSAASSPADSSPQPRQTSVLPELDPEPGEDASYSGGPLLYPEASYQCRYIPTDNLFPTGVVAEDEHGTIELGSSSSCSVDLDTNGDGYANGRDGVGDSVSLDGGLTDAIDGSVTDVNTLRGDVFWGPYCTYTWKSVTPPDGWTRADACMDGEDIKGLTYLLVGHSEENKPVAFACGVNSYGPTLNNREIAAESTCFGVMQGLLGGD